MIISILYSTISYDCLIVKQMCVWKYPGIPPGVYHVIHFYHYWANVRTVTYRPINPVCSHILCVYQYWYIFSHSRPPTWLLFYPIHVILWYRILLLITFLNSRFICERMLQIDVLQYWFMLNALRVTDILNLSILSSRRL